MSSWSNKFICQVGTLAMGAAAGALAFVMLMLLGGWTFWAAVLAAGAIAGVLWLLLASILCVPLEGPVQPGTAGRTPGDIELSARARRIADGGARAGAPTASAAAAHDAAASVKVATAETARDTSDAAKATPDKVSQATTKATDAAKDAAGAAKETAAKAAEKTREAARTATATVTGAAEKTADATRAGAEKVAAKADEAGKAAKAATPEVRKDDAADADADEDPGTKPETLSAPRDGKADNLKEIKGVGPKMEKMLHGMGFFHFDQIASWSADEVAWVNANLTGFKGRVTRDDWVAQAKVLAAGGDTEFSKRVDDGDVY